jgi:16S rRNA (cytidine1402-2'-O)-methyltransferase
MPASLYVVASPIGNLDDITLRALQTLKTVGLIAAEDTRRTSILLRHFGINTPTTSFHEHNERQKLPHLIHKLTDGTDVALVSDAGTPLIADPGQRLIAAAIENAIRVVPIPGASALLSALMVAGFAVNAFVFAGFVPARSNDRKKWLSSFADEKRAVVLFETPHRIKKTLEDIADIFGERPITIARELTKLHEDIQRTTTKHARELQIAEKGEFTLVLGPIFPTVAPVEVIDEKEIADYFYHLTESEGFQRRAALTRTARNFGLTTKQLYSTLERLKALTPS